jgi:hypothetical protein
MTAAFHSLTICDSVFMPPFNVAHAGSHSELMIAPWKEPLRNKQGDSMMSALGDVGIVCAVNESVVCLFLGKRLRCDSLVVLGR